MQRKMWLFVPIWKTGLSSMPFFRKIPMPGVRFLADLAPENWQIDIYDENIQGELTVDEFERRLSQYNVVGFSATTAAAPRAYALAHIAKSYNVSTIMGGIHASACPQEATKHVDCVVIGEADDVFPVILKDWEKGKLNFMYSPVFPDLRTTSSKFITEIPYGVPGYRVPLVQTQRGCPVDCAYCFVTANNGNRVRARPVRMVVEAIEKFFLDHSSRSRFVVFADDNLAVNPRYAEELFTALKPLKLRWLSQTDIRLANNPKLLKLASESGMIGVFVGIEALNRQDLATGASRVKAAWNIDLLQAIKKFHDCGVLVEGAFMFGLDSHTLEIFEITLNFALKVPLDLAQFTLYTPFPGTELFREAEQQGRIFAKTPNGDYDWAKFTSFQAVMALKKMTTEEANSGLRWAYNSFYRQHSIISRLVRAGVMQRPWLEQLAAYVANLGFSKIQL